MVEQSNRALPPPFADAGLTPNATPPSIAATAMPIAAIPGV